MFFEGGQQLLFVEIGKNITIDEEGGGGAVAVIPFHHLFRRAGRGVNVNFGKFDAAFIKPQAGTPAARAPAGAIHHHSALRQSCIDNGFLFSWLFGSGHRVNATQFGQQHFIIGLEVNIVDINILNDTPLVNHEECSLAPTIAEKYIIFKRDPTMRPKIAQQRIGDATEGIGPCFQAGNGVNGDAQNLGIQSRELGLIGLVRRDLTRSYRRPRQRKEGQDDVLSPQVAQLEVFIQMARQDEIGS
jgi:hypothetical protein